MKHFQPYSLFPMSQCRQPLAISMKNVCDERYSLFSPILTMIRENPLCLHSLRISLAKQLSVGQPLNRNPYSVKEIPRGWFPDHHILMLFKSKINRHLSYIPTSSILSGTWAFCCVKISQKESTYMYASVSELYWFFFLFILMLYSPVRKKSTEKKFSKSVFQMPK